MTFEGIRYRTATNWLTKVPVTTEAIKYIEIGVFYGANAISVAQIYATHPDSEIHCVDPWIDYDEYTEYKGKQEMTFAAFSRNIATLPFKDKFRIHRGFSRDVAKDFEDGAYDMVYIDGNHNADYVMEDAVTYFRKLKVGGYLIFDDCGPTEANATARGIQNFLRGYQDRLEVLGGLVETQLFARKLN